MTTADFTVPSVSCGHCIAAIQRAVTALPGVQTVTGDPDTKRVQVTFEPPATREQIVAAMTAEDYPPLES